LGVALVLLLLNLKTVEPAAAAVAVTAVMYLITTQANLIHTLAPAARQLLDKDLLAVREQAGVVVKLAAAVARQKRAVLMAQALAAMAFLLQ